MLGQVLSGKDAGIPHTLRDLVASIHLHEITAQPLRRYFAGDGFGVDCVPSLLDGVFARIRPEDLNRSIQTVLGQKLKNCDRQSVRFFSGRASGAPDANGPLGRPILNQSWKYIEADRIPEAGIPEETRDV